MKRWQARLGRRPTSVLCGVLAVTVASMAAPLAAQATTGATPLAHPPRFSVTAAQAAPYMGAFKMVQPSDRQLISGAYGAGRNERGFVEGSIEIYHYEAAGRETILLGRTYEYHAVGDRMDVDIISPSNQTILARLRLRPTGSGKLSGTLKSLLPPGPPRRITLAPASGGQEIPTEAVAPSEQPDDAGTVPPSSAAPASPAKAVVAAVLGVFYF